MTLPTHPPIFSAGVAQTDLEVVSDFAVDSIKIDAITGWNNFVVGDHVWTFESSPVSQLEYRGTVTAKAASYVNVTRGARVAIASGTGKVFRKATSWSPAFLHNAPESRRDLGIDTNIALDGTVYRTQVRTALEHIFFRWEKLKTADLTDWWTFVGSSISDGVDLFDLSWYDFRQVKERIATVMLLDRASAFREMSMGVSRNLTIEVAIQSETAYA